MDIELIHSRSLKRTKNGIIRNGNSLGPAWIGARLIKIKNTCPFDSVVELLSTAYIDNNNWKEHVDRIKDSCSALLLMEDYVQKGTSTQLYQQRASILYELYGYQNNILDCKDNVSFLISRMLEDLPSCSRIKACDSCGSELSIRTSIEVYHTAVSRLEIQGFIDDYFLDRSSSCKKCNNICTTKINAGIQVMLDLEFALDGDFHREIYPDASDTVNIADLPKKICIKGNTYILNRLIAYLPPHTEDDIGHYIAICRRITDNWEIHDDRNMELEKVINPKKFSVKATILLYSQV